MLRESTQIADQKVSLRAVTEGFGDDDSEIPHAARLVDFAEAVVLRQDDRAAKARQTLDEVLGNDGLVDAAATVAAFHGFVRIADAIGIPYHMAAQGQDVPDLREEAGINDFYRIAGEG